MEEFYYQKMDRQKQAVYHGMLQGVRQLADQIQLPRVDGKEPVSYTHLTLPTICSV